MQVVLASGRIRPSMLQFAEPLGVTRPMICSNGGHIVGSDGGDLSVDLLDLKSLDSIFAYAESSGVHVSVYTRRALYFLHDTEWGEAYAKRVRSVMPQTKPLSEIRGEEVLKVLLIDTPPRIQEHILNIAPLIDPALCRMTESEPEYLELMPAHVSKGAALKTLAEHLGIDQGRVAAIGDYLNDLEMMQFAGHSAAVGNAAEATRLAADRVVGTNEQGGVAEFIDFLLAGS